MALLLASNDCTNKTKKYGQTKQTKKLKIPTNQVEMCAVTAAYKHEIKILQTASAVINRSELPGCWAQGTMCGDAAPQDSIARLAHLISGRKVFL